MALPSFAQPPKASPEAERHLGSIMGEATKTSFSQLVGDHVDFIWRCVRRFGVRDADADDACQQVFLVANDKLDQIRAGQERAFLIGVATRVASHARRGYQRREAAEQRLSADVEPSSPVHPTPEELTQKLQARELLDRVLEGMPEDLRTVFVLFELEEMSVDRIAKVLEIPRGTAATRLRRSREVFHIQAKRVKAETLRLGGAP